MMSNVTKWSVFQNPVTYVMSLYVSTFCCIFLETNTKQIQVTKIIKLYSVVFNHDGTIIALYQFNFAPIISMYRLYMHSQACLSMV